jgi:isoquinoline 1-oxidoreductase alpha subunit
MQMSFTLQINGQKRTVDVDADTPLLWVVRDVLGMTGTKFGCGMGLCGACTVHVDGQATRSCITPVESVAGKAVTTIEGIGATTTGQAVRHAWIKLDVVQCGYCQPGQIMSACALLKETPNPSDEDIRTGMAGNLCRCGTYARIHQAVREASVALSAPTHKQEA